MGKKKNSNTEKKAIGQTKDYYNGKNQSAEKGAEIKKDAALDTHNQTVRDANQSIGDIGQDFVQVMKKLGYQEDDINQDFVKSAGRLAEDKATGLEAIDYYVKTQNQRTQEDLDTALEKEGRRYEIQKDRDNLDMTKKNQVFGSFGGVRQEVEGRSAATHGDQVQGFQRAASRSFADIKRDEYVKTQAVIQTYTRGMDDATDTKTRGLRDVGLAGENAGITRDRGIRDANDKIDDANTTLDNTNKAIDFDTENSKRDNNYNMNDDISTIQNRFEDRKQNQKLNAEDKALFG